MLTSSWIKQLPLTAITQVTPVGGGDVNQAYRIDTGDKALLFRWFNRVILLTFMLAK